MIELARLSTLVGRAVVAKTGLDGFFECTFRLRPVRQAIPTVQRIQTARPSLMIALVKQLGLRLVSSRDPVAVFVVDGVERPTPD